MNEQPIGIPEELIRPLCEPFRRQADNLLDLYQMTQQEFHPGKCVQCFYRLLATAEPRQQTALEPLKSWIENNIEISIEANNEFLGGLPVTLDQPDLAQLCNEAIRRVQMDVVAPGEIVELAFRRRATA